MKELKNCMVLGYAAIGMVAGAVVAMFTLYVIKKNFCLCERVKGKAKKAFKQIDNITNA